jgi:hypothetical protein
VALQELAQLELLVQELELGVLLLEERELDLVKEILELQLLMEGLVRRY